MSNNDTLTEAELQAITDQLLESLKTDFIGFAVATTIYGITILQVSLYFRGFPKDKLHLKALVALLLVLDTAASALTATSIYTLQIVNFGNVIADLRIPLSFRLENGVTILITYIVQIYFSERLWRLSKNNWLVALIAILGTGSFACGLRTTVVLLMTSESSVLEGNIFLTISGLSQGLAALCDIFIAAGLCYYLHVSRNGIHTTEVLIDVLIIYTVNRGILTAVVQTLFMITNVAFPDRQIWLPFHQAVSKLYVNSFLATLNVRKGLNSMGRGITDPSQPGSGSMVLKSRTNPLARLRTVGRPTTDVVDVAHSQNLPRELEINVMKTQITDCGRNEDYPMKSGLFKTPYETDESL